MLCLVLCLAAARPPKIKKLKGLIAAPHTPFKEDGSVNLDVIPSQIDLLVKNNVTGAYVCGTTGEGISCSVEERKSVLKTWRDYVNQKGYSLTLIAHVGALSVEDSRELARYAQEIGMDATSIVPPGFFKPGSIDSLIDYINSVISDTAPDLPFYYYHTSMSGVTFDMEKFLIAADGRIPQLAGIKFNYPDLYMYQRCLRACGGKYDIPWGIDEWFSGAIASGAHSAVGSTYNYAAPVYYDIWKAYGEGNYDGVKHGMQKVVEIVDVLNKFGGVAAGKAMMKYHNIDVGDPRLPVDAITAENKKECVDALERILNE